MAADQRQRRFTVTVDEAVYQKLQRLARDHDPPLSLTYVAQYAIKLLLERAADPQRRFEFADPTKLTRPDV